MNPRPPQRRTSFGAVPLSDVFDVGGFDLDGGRGDHDHHHHQDDDVNSLAYRSGRPFHGPRFAQFMSALVKSYRTRLLRYRGVLNMAREERKIIFQGVHQLMSHDAGAPWTRASRGREGSCSSASSCRVSC